MGGFIKRGQFMIGQIMVQGSGCNLEISEMGDSEDGKMHIHCLNLFLNFPLNAQLLGLKLDRDGANDLINSLYGRNIVGNSWGSGIKLLEGIPRF
uniref:Uncharacterized protein n=1 Tax=Romanomermis culicivorax TaxID=13658 RepID=A0A915HPU6_ROMCU